MASDDKRCNTKGDFLIVPQVKKAPEVDFSSLEEKTALRFDDDSRLYIKWLLSDYLTTIRLWDGKESPQKLKRKMQSVIAACSTLEGILQYSRVGEARDGEHNSLEFQSWLRLVPGEIQIDTESVRESLPHGGLVADYLKNLRRKAESVLSVLVSVPGRPGPRRNEAVRRFMKGLYQVYIRSGGQRPGYHRNRDTNTYWGGFLVLSRALLSKELVGADLSYEYSHLYEYMGEIVPKSTAE